VERSGLVELRGDGLAAAGWDLGAIDPRGIHLFQAGQELPLEIAGVEEGALMHPGARLRFVGRASRSRYTAQALYWLTHDHSPGLRAPPALDASDPLRWEEDRRYDSRYTAGGDGWFARELFAGAGISATLMLPAPLQAGAELLLRLQGETLRDHVLTLFANGRYAGTVRWSDAAYAPAGPARPYTAALTLPFALPAGLLRLDLALDSPGLPTDVALLDWLELPQVRPPYDSVPQTPALAAHAPLDLRRGPADGQAGADYLVISHADFIPALGPLLESKARRGRRAAVVDVQAAYDAWSYGERNPEAIRALIRAAAGWTPPPAAVLLVGAGSVRMRPAPGQPDATFIPPYLVEADPWLGEVACDTCYTRLDADDVRDDPLPNLPIGRFPVRSLAEAELLVRKSVAYADAPPPGAWQTTALLLADNDRLADGTPDPVGGFEATAESAAALLDTQMQVRQFRYDPGGPDAPPRYRDPAALRCDLFRALDGGLPGDPRCAPLPAGAPNGAALLAYIGHGSPWQWAQTSYDDPVPFLWNLYDADSRHNAGRLPILLAMTCLTGAWQNPDLPTTDERLLLAPHGGIAAALSATGLGVNTGHEALLRGLLPQLLGQQGEPRTLGAAHLAGLTELLRGGCCADLAYTYGILGDPETVLPLETARRVYLPFVAK
jgi:hypothetical protein